MKGTIDLYGRVWHRPQSQLCPECGQPVSRGPTECDHQPLTDEQVAELGGSLFPDILRR